VRAVPHGGVLTMIVTRRSVVQGLAAGVVATRIATGEAAEARAATSFRAWDVHCHLGPLPGDTPEEKLGVLVEHMDRLGIERVIVSQGFEDHETHPTPDEVRLENDRVMRAVKHYPDRALGALYVSPDDVAFCLEEFDRCVRDGPMVSVGELESDVRCNSTALDPIVERAVAMNVPILQHTWYKTGGNEPGESTPFDLVELAKRHPEAKFICAHTGGTWEVGIRVIRETKNIWAEVAGSDPTSGFTEMAVRELGAERVVFGSDAGGRTFASQMAKVVGADISDAQKEMILGGNLRQLLAPMLKAKGISA
jgi:predicted TIM-barrel fold metal-dependent hydrolase